MKYFFSKNKPREECGVFGISDHDKKGNLFGGEHGVTGYGREWDQEKQNKLKEVQRRNDLSEGRATPTRNEAYKLLEGTEVLDDYSDARARRKRDEQLSYMMAAIPGLAEVLNDEIYKQRMRIELNSPSEILGRINKSRTNYIDAIKGRAEAQKNIADAVYKGYDRYSGIRNVAG